jgi:hypothetical protein
MGVIDVFDREPRPDVGAVAAASAKFVTAQRQESGRAVFGLLASAVEGDGGPVAADRVGDPHAE